MRIKVLDTIIENAKRNMNTQEKREDLDGIMLYVGIVNKLCKKIIEENPNITGNQLHYTALTYMQKISEDYCKNASMRGMIFELEAVSRLLLDKDKIKKVYERSKNLKYDPKFIYTANMEKCYTGVMTLAISQLEEDLSIIEEFDQKTLDIIKKYCMANKTEKAKLRVKYPKLDLRNLEKYETIIFDGNYINKIENKLRLLQESWEENIKEQQIEVIMLIGKFLNNITFML